MENIPNIGILTYCMSNEWCTVFWNSDSLAIDELIFQILEYQLIDHAYYDVGEPGGITGYLRREVIALGRFKHNWIVIVLFT